MKRPFALLLISALLVAQTVSGDDFGALLQQQQEIQRQVRNPGLVSAGGPDCPTDKSELLKACLNAVCPLDPANPGYTTIQNRIQSEAAGRFDRDWKSLKPVLEKWRSDKIADITAKAEALQKQLSTDKTSIDPRLIPLHNMMFLLNMANDGLGGGLITAAPDGSLVIDAQKARAQLKNVSTADQDWLIGAIQNFYNLPAVRKAFAVGSQSAPALLEQKYPGVPFSEALKREAERLDAREKALSEKMQALGLPDAQIPLPQYLIHAAKTGTLSDEARAESFLQLDFLSTAIIDPTLNPSKYPWLTQRSPKDLSQLVQSTNIAERIQSLKTYLNSQEFSQSMKGILDTCVATYSQSMLALPSREDLQSSRKMANEVIGDLKSRVFSRLSAHTAAMLDGVFSKAEVLFPSSAYDFDHEFPAGLKEEVAADSKELTDIQQHRGNAAQLNLLFAYAFTGPNWDPANYVKSQFNYCDQRKLGSLDDRANQSEAVFWASWLTLKNQRAARGVMAHEMGHIMDLAIQDGKPSLESAMKYQTIKACLASKHPEDADLGGRPAEVPIEIESTGGPVSAVLAQHNAEDFADQVAAIAEPDLNVGCFLITPTDRDNLSVVNANPTDPHSSDFFRALFSEQVRKGQLPDACTAALSDAGWNRDFSSCF